MRKRFWLLTAVILLTVCLFGCKAKIEDPIEYLSEAGQEYGYSNALSELTELSNNQLEDAGFLRLQQNYRGIPVYGRTVVYVTDERGNPLTITENVLDVDEALNLTPTLSPADAQALIASQREGAAPEIGEDDLCIYNLGSDGASHLAYCVALGGCEILLDAHSGEVLMESVTIEEESVTGYAHSDWTQEAGVSVRKESDDEYVLADDSRRMKVYTLHYSPMTYTVSKDGKEETHDACHDGTAMEIISADNIFGNTPEEIIFGYEQGVVLLHLAGKIQDYYLEAVSYRSDYDIHLYYNDGFYSGNNGLGGFCDHGYGVISIGYNHSPGQVDLVAHEYTHIVSRDIVQWYSQGETGAINEAISDIFGELVEGWYYKQEPDWIHNNRNLRHPAVTKSPAFYYGAYWGDPTDMNTDKGNRHLNSTVISHAAYLMSESSGGLLALDELANLWYRAMLMMPATCTFTECRERVEWAALTMSDLSDEKRACISQAFDHVGIPSTRICLAPDSKLTVLDRLWMPYDDYTISIWYYDVADPENDLLPPDDVVLKLLKTEKVTSTEPYIMDLRPGFYIVELTDGADPRKVTEFELSISPFGPAEKELETNFGACPLRVEVYSLGTVAEGATVTAEIDGEQFTAVTDEFGACTFILPETAREIHLTAHKDGLGSDTAHMTLTENDLLKRLITAEPLILPPPYGEIVTQYEQDWGTAKWLGFGGGYYYGSGVFYLDLLDFDGDGIDELVMGYGKGSASYADQIIEIWTMVDGVPTMVHQDAAMHGSDISRWFQLREADGKWYVGSGWDGYETEIIYYGLANGKMYQTVSFSRTIDEATGNTVYMANGKEISGTEFIGYYSLWQDSCETWQCLCMSGGWSAMQERTDSTRAALNLPPIS